MRLLLSSIMFWLCNSGKEGGLRALSKESQPEFFGKLFLERCPSPAVTESAWSGQGKVGLCCCRALRMTCHTFTCGFRDVSFSGHVSSVLRSVLLPVLQLWDCCGCAVWVSQAALTWIGDGRGFCYSTKQIIVQNV